MLRERIGALGLPLKDFAVEEIGFFSVAGSRNAQLMYAFRGPDIDRLQCYARGARRAHARRGRLRGRRRSPTRPASPRSRSRSPASAPPISASPRSRSAAPSPRSSPATRRRPSRRAASATTCACRCGPSTATIRASSSWCACARRAARWCRCATSSTPRIGSGPVQIDRESRTRSITVSRQPGRQGGGARRTSRSRASRSELGIGGEYEFAGGRPDASGCARPRPRSSSPSSLALVAIYMILAAQFNSFVHPLHDHALGAAVVHRRLRRRLASRACRST